MWVWFVGWAVIAFIVYAALYAIYKKEPPWFIAGAWFMASITVVLAWAIQGDLAAANKATAWAALLIFLHVTHWLYIKAKGGAKKLADAIPKKTHIDDSIYDQVAAELSTNQIHAGLMARAIAEADGDKDRTQAIYIKLRAAAIAAEREPVQQGESDSKEFTDALKTNDTRDQFVKNMIRTDLSPTDAVAGEYAKSFIRRAGIIILWYLVVSFGTAVIMPFLDLLKIEQPTNQDIGTALLLAALSGGVALLSYLGTQKLKW